MMDAQLEKIDALERDGIVESFKHSLGSKQTPRNVVVNGPPGAGKSTIVKTIAAQNPTSSLLYVTLNGSLSKAADENFKEFTNVFPCTLDSFTYAALLVLAGNVTMAAASAEHRLRDGRTLQGEILWDWGNMRRQTLPSFSNKVIAKICAGESQMQEKYLVWPVLRRIVAEDATLGNIAQHGVRGLRGGDGPQAVLAKNLRKISSTSAQKLENLTSASIIFIDEAQDLDVTFLKIVLKHFCPYKTVVWLGDPGQTIYSDGDTHNLYSLLASGPAERKRLKRTLDLDIDDFEEQIEKKRLRKSYRMPLRLSSMLRFLGSGPFVGNGAIPECSVQPSGALWTTPDADLGRKKTIYYLFHKNSSIWRTATNGEFYGSTFEIHGFNQKKQRIISTLAAYEQAMKKYREGNSKTSPPSYPEEVCSCFGSQCNISTQTFQQTCTDIVQRGAADGDAGKYHFILGTVHSYKGGEFDTWRIAHDVFTPELDVRSRNLVNVALSRGTERVFLDGPFGKALAAVYLFSSLPSELKKQISQWLGP